MALMPAVYTALFLALCCWYAAVVRRMCVGEPWALGVLGMLVVATAAFRLHSAQQFIPNFYCDELKDYWQAGGVFEGNASPFGAQGGSGLPTLLSALVEHPLHLVLPTWWAIRAWPIACGVLAVVGAYGVVRAIGCGAVAALFAAACIAVLPWAQAYGLTTWGGEMVWHELVILWVVAVLLPKGGDACARLSIFGLWPMSQVRSLSHYWVTAGDASAQTRIVFTGIIALTLLVFDYFNGRSVVWMLVAMLPMLRQRDWVIVAMLAGAALCYLPVALNPGNPFRWVGFLPGHIVGSATNPDTDAILPQVQFALRGFYDSELNTGGSMNLARVMNTPLPLLLLAGAGWLVASWQIKWLLACVFLIGLTPGVLTRHVTSHHILMAAVAIPLAAACAVDKPWILAVLLAGWLTVISMQQIMDPEMWAHTSWDQRLPETER